MKPMLILSASLLALAACSEAGDATANNSVDDTAMVDETENTAAVDDVTAESNMAAAPAVTTPEYLAAAGAGDLFEIESSKAALGSTKNAAIKSFAQMMVDNHTQSTAKVKAAAQQASLTVPAPKLTPAQQTMLDEIKAASGTARDTVYLRHQATAHQEALALHKGYASSGDTPSLKTAAGEIAPVVEKHIGELSKITA